MWKAPASVLCGCLAALPLIGCAGSGATSGQATAVAPAATAEPTSYYAPATRVYAVGPAAPAAVPVLWPGDDNLARSDPGTGAPPKVQVKRSGDCGTDTPAITRQQPSMLPAPPAPRPNPPRLIEASAVGKSLPPAAKVRRLAELIKSARPG